MPYGVAIEEMTEEPTVKIRRPKHPICDWEGEVHIDLHHQAVVMVGSMVAPDSIYKGTVPNKPILIHMTVEVHKLINEIHASCGADEQPCDI